MFVVAACSAGAETQNSTSQKFVFLTIEYTCQVSSTSAQQSRRLRVLKMLTLHGRIDAWMDER